MGHQRRSDPAGVAVDRPGEVGSSSTVHGRATSGGNYRALIVLVAVLSVVIALLAVIGGSSDPSDTAGQDEASSGTGPAGLVGTTGAPETGAATTATTISPNAAPETTVVPTTMVPGRFLVGEPTGLWLFFGGVDPLQRLDLDTGEVTRYGLQADPVLATGPDLVLYQREVGIVGWVLATDPGEQALTWKRGPVAVGDEPSHLWILDRETDMEHPSGEPVGPGRWELFDTDANRVLERRPGDLDPAVEAELAPRQQVGGGAEMIRPGPALSSRTDGVYAYDESGYRRLGPGRVYAYDDRAALVGTCPPVGAAGDCDLRWIDRASGEPVEQPLPTGRIRYARVLAGGDWLHTIDDELSSELLQRSTGRRIVGDWVSQPAISPDGRWLALLSDGSVTVTDLSSDRRVLVFDGFDQSGGGSLLFVERPADAP